MPDPTTTNLAIGINLDWFQSQVTAIIMICVLCLIVVGLNYIRKREWNNIWTMLIGVGVIIVTVGMAAIFLGDLEAAKDLVRSVLNLDG